MLPADTAIVTMNHVTIAFIQEHVTMAFIQNPHLNCKSQKFSPMWTKMPGIARHRRCLAGVRHRLASMPVIVDAPGMPEASMPSGVDQRVMPGGVGDRKLVTSIFAAAWSFLLVIAAL